MKRYSLLISLLCIKLCFSADLYAQGFLHADGKRIVNEKGDNVLLRGIGLGGWMLQEGYMLKINKEGQQYRIRERLEELAGAGHTQEFYDSWLTNHTTKADIDAMKGWGFNSVRLPMHYNLYTLPIEKEPVAGKNTWIEKGFAMTDSLLAWCKANQMYLILDLHAVPGGQGNDVNISDRDGSKPSLWENEENQKKTIALWKKLAERYANEPWIGGYDIINEPNWGFEDLAKDKNGTRETKNIPLKKFMVDVTSAIREVDKQHLIIIEGNGWGNNYNGILPQWDNNMALSFHKYWTYNDSSSIAHVIKMRDQYNLPVWIGETGENSNVWFTDAIRLFEKNNIGWAWWPLKKIGINNPIEIKSNPDYNKVIDYLNNGGDKPSESVAYKGLMELAEGTRIENTVVHQDVIDAMIRQPFTAKTKPFNTGNKVLNSSIIKAVDYDLGISGAAYFDKDTADYHVSTGKSTPGNKGRVYRNDGVDISKKEDGSYYVSSIESGEWLQYTVDVVKKGKYTIQIGYSSSDSNSSIDIVVNGIILVKGLKLPSTNDLKNFKIINTKDVKLKAGKQKIRIYVEAGGFNLSNIQFTH